MQKAKTVKPGIGAALYRGAVVERRKIDSGNLTAEPRRQITRRSAYTGADVKDMAFRAKRQLLCKGADTFARGDAVKGLTLQQIKTGQEQVIMGGLHNVAARTMHFV